MTGSDHDLRVCDASRMSMRISASQSVSHTRRGVFVVDLVGRLERLIVIVAQVVGQLDSDIFELSGDWRAWQLDSKICEKREHKQT